MARKPKPWWHAEKKAWYVNINGERYKLGPDKDEAHREFHRLLSLPPEQRAPKVWAPALKPVELAARAMRYSSRSGENILDLFGGSGSTLMAAEQTSRHAYLMELDPLYCDVIVERWEKFTGQKAQRISMDQAA